MRFLFGFKFDATTFTGVIGVLGLACVALANAQPNIDNARILRDAKRAPTAIFLDRTRSVADRMEAAKHLGFPEDATLPSLLAIGVDRTQDDAIRLQALLHHRYNEKYIDAVLQILADPHNGGVELQAHLIDDLSRRETFMLPEALKERIRATYRMLMDDPREKVRVHAFRALIADQDPAAVDRLTESLRNERNFPVPLAEAIDLLDMDGPSKHIAVLRPYLNHADPAVQAQAARALAIDSQSRPRIIDLAKSPQTPSEVRVHALRALAREDPQFPSYAIDLMEDPRTDPKIRDAAMRGVAGRMNYHKIDAQTQIRFAQAVEKISEERNLLTNDARKVQKSAKELNFHLRRSFPEIKSFYKSQ